MNRIRNLNALIVNGRPKVIEFDKLRDKHDYPEHVVYIRGKFNIYKQVFFFNKLIKQEKRGIKNGKTL